MNKKNIVIGIIQLIKKAETELPKDVVYALEDALSKEEGIAKLQLETILKNIELAKNSQRPMCQDTGIQTFFVDVGIDFPYITDIEQWITDAVQKATKEIPLRPNTVDPFSGENHGDNIGESIPYINWNFNKGDNVKITAFPKGGGSENMSKLGMLKPNVGIEGIKSFVVEEIINAGGNACPPTIIGIGIGGGADLAMKLGKKALIRPIGKRHSDKKIACVELDLIRQINKSGIGPMGLGGKTTCLDVHIEKAHRHPASLPVGIVVQCWANRRAQMTINSDKSWKVM
jgi:fumarate hydratase subunit alpha